jgi:hypothetical protein
MPVGRTSNVRKIKRQGKVEIAGHIIPSRFSGDIRFASIDKDVIQKFPDLLNLNNNWKVKYELIPRTTKRAKITGLVERGK